jgi:hypothetical protein
VLFELLVMLRVWRFVTRWVGLASFIDHPPSTDPQATVLLFGTTASGQDYKPGTRVLME